jgi:hypothetical protein
MKWEQNKVKGRYLSCQSIASWPAPTISLHVVQWENYVTAKGLVLHYEEHHLMLRNERVYWNTQSVPRSKHTPSRLYKPVS